MAETEQTSARLRLRDPDKTSFPPVSLRLSKQGRGRGRGRGRGTGSGSAKGRSELAEEKQKVVVEQPRPSAEDERILAKQRAVKLELLKGKHLVISCVQRPKHPELEEVDEKEQPISRLKSLKQRRQNLRKNTAKLKLSKDYRDWAALPPQALRVVFEKLGVIGVLASAQSVCPKWRAVAKTVFFIPCIIDLRILPESILSQIDTEKLAISAFHRTTGSIEELHVMEVGGDFLTLIAHRTSTLKCFSLIETLEVSPTALLTFLRHCPLLEELSICLCPNLHDSYPDIARACPGLKRLFVNGYIDDFYIDSDSDYRMIRKAVKYDGMDDSDDPDDPDSDNDPDPDSDDDGGPLSTGDRMAMEIAKCMPQLNGLRIVRDIGLTNKGVNAILDNCLQLVYLDLRRCYYVRADNALRTRLDKIKTVRLSRRSVLVLTKLLGKRPYL